MSKDPTPTAHEYASRKGLAVRETLGGGIHGVVFLLQGSRTWGGTALKVFHFREFFQRELMVYERLKMAQVRQIRGFAVPQLLGADGELMALEMTVVERPYLLDFAGTYLDDEEPQFDKEKLEMWETDKREKFGDQWPEVQAVLANLETYGIHMLDVNPGNLAFAR